MTRALIVKVCTVIRELCIWKKLRKKAGVSKSLIPHIYTSMTSFNTSMRVADRSFIASTKRERKWFEEAGCMKRQIPGPKGGIVLWDSRTVHAGAQPIFGRKNMGRWRFVCFVCMAPAIWADAEDLRKKVDGYNKLQCSNHWPISSIKFFNSGRITDCHITSLPPEAQTPEALQLVGVQPYDFNDGRPNGPPKPETVVVEPVKTSTSGPQRRKRPHTP